MLLNHNEITKTFHLLSKWTGTVWWAARKGDKLEGSYAASPFELIEFAEVYKDWNFYVQPNPSTRLHGRRCRTEDISHWAWFLIDLDLKADIFRASSEEQDAAIWEARRLIEAYSGLTDLSPYIIHSGRGVQLWYPLDAKDFASYGGDYDIKRVSPETGDVEVVRTIPIEQAIPLAQAHWLSYLASHFRSDTYEVDTSTSDLPRLMRCPGTINQKTGKLAWFMAQDIHASDPSKRLAHKILDYTPSAKLQTPEQAFVPEGSPWQIAAAITRSRTAADFLSFGATEPGRHKAAAATARALAEAGISEFEIIKALVWGGERCRPVLDDADYIARTAHDAVRRLDLTNQEERGIVPAHPTTGGTDAVGS